MSDVVVLKFGGTSVATPARVRRAARRVAAHVRRGRRVVAVVSAAGAATDRILTAVARLGRPDLQTTLQPLEAVAGRAREVDRALATGEDRSAALLGLALWRLGVPARSLRGGEAGVRADGAFGGGRIARVDATQLRALLAAGVVPVVSGFQGERADGETVTLGRGGSDTSAVAVAAALGAVCHIVTDVDAVYDRDPRVDPDAQPFAVLDHAALTALVERGAQVVHPSAAHLAAEAGVPLRVYHFRERLARRGTRITAGTASAPVRGHAGPAVPASCDAGALRAQAGGAA